MDVELLANLQYFLTLRFTAIAVVRKIREVEG